MIKKVKMHQLCHIWSASRLSQLHQQHDVHSLRICLSSRQ